MQDHKCFMQPLGPKKELVEREEAEAEEDEDESGEDEEEGEDAEEEEKEERPKPLKTYVFYDFETKQERVIDSNEHGEIYAHAPICAWFTLCASIA